MTDIRLRTQKDLVELAALAIGLEGPFVDSEKHAGRETKKAAQAFAWPP
ncbi:hypothetical protein ACK249_005710 [Pseudomonas aeruginosa]|nr:hypothetical protein [Pseudomonas aeruginosa]